MITLPAGQPAPTLIDIHNKPCVVLSGGGCSTTIDLTSTAQNMSNAVWAFLQYRGITGNPVVFGEAWSNNPTTSCDGGTQAMAQESVTGYLQSTLYSSVGGNVVLRPWGDAIMNCTTPLPIGAPNGPYAP